MWLTFVIICALIFSMFVNTTIKSWVHHAIDLELQKVEDEDDIPSSVFYSTLALIIVNNMIPFTLGAIIGLYAIL